jgi:hypothetical protein
MYLARIVLSKKQRWYNDNTSQRISKPTGRLAQHLTSMTRGSTEPNTRLQASIGSTTTQRCDHDHTLLTTVATLRREVLPNQADIPPSRPPSCRQEPSWAYCTWPWRDEHHCRPAARAVSPTIGATSIVAQGKVNIPQKRSHRHPEGPHRWLIEGAPRSIYDDMKVTYEEQIHHRKTARMSPTPRSFTSRDSAQLQKMYDKYSQPWKKRW